METILQKHLIMETVRTLNGDQTARLLQYLRGLTSPVIRHEASTLRRSRNEAMSEIRHALSKGTSNNSF